MLCYKKNISQLSLNVSLSWSHLINQIFPEVKADFIHRTYECQVPCRRFLDTLLEGVDWVNYICMKFFHCFAILDYVIPVD
jgi:hypothetical protein